MATTTKKKLPLFPLISLLSFTSIFYLLSQFRNTSSSSSSIKAFSSIHNFQIDNNRHRRGSCDYSDGIWIYDESRVSRYDSNCKEIFKGWNCVKGNKANGVEVAKWRWKSNGWWAPSKFDPVNSPMLFFKNGQPVIPPLRPDQGLDMVLEHMKAYVEEKARPGAVKFFRTQSPRHFEGGDWDQGGSCQRDQPLSAEQVEELFSVKNNGTNVEVRLVNEHLNKALKGSSFVILNITYLSELRADAHPASAGGKKHDDCMHWCLPGITDTWNDLFVEYLNSIEHRS
ncbi:hypothetical protein RYX36_008791 [Vicia faba]